jgi:hypothetical protein
MTISTKEAETAIAEIKETLAKVDAAKAKNDWITLRQLGYANRIDGAREGQYRYEFREQQYYDDKRASQMTPDQYATWLNNALDR